MAGFHTILSLFTLGYLLNLPPSRDCLPGFMRVRRRGNFNSLLGNGSWVDSSLPVAVNTNGALRGKSLSQLTAGGSTCALSSEGRAYCWGGNHWGQLGDGSTTDSNIPVAVNTNGVLSGKTVSQLTTGGAHTCLLSSHGQAYCWGWNGWGQLGSGSATAASLPVAVDSSGVLSGKTLTQVALGNNHTCALTAEGRAYCWGSNNWGQLGNGSTTSSNLPVAVDTGGALSRTRVTQIAARGDHTCALTSEGRAYCWGWNGWGQLGNGSTTSSNVPVAVDTSGILGGRNVHQISCGYAHTAALMASAGELAGLTESGQVLFTTNLSTWTQLLGTFHQLVSGDFDGNGQPDLAGLTADGSIYHSADLLTWIHIPGRLKQLLAADLDGNGHTDLAGLTADGSIYYSTDLMTWTPIPGRLKQLLAADLDGNGSADLAGLIAGQVYYSTNRLTWTHIPGRIKQLVAADLDGNGTADLAGLAPSGSIFHSTNLTSWTQVPGRLDQLLAADLDGNGTADLAGLLFMGAPNGQIYVSTDLLTWTQISGRLSQLIAGDLDGNGTADLAGLTSVGQIFYSTNRATWNQIPGTLSQLILFQ